MTLIALQIHKSGIQQKVSDQKLLDLSLPNFALVECHIFQVDFGEMSSMENSALLYEISDAHEENLKCAVCNGYQVGTSSVHILKLFK